MAEECPSVGINSEVLEQIRDDVDKFFQITKCCGEIGSLRE